MHTASSWELAVLDVLTSVIQCCVIGPASFVVTSSDLQSVDAENVLVNTNIRYNLRCRTHH